MQVYSGNEFNAFLFSVFRYIKNEVRGAKRRAPSFLCFSRFVKNGFLSFLRFVKIFGGVPFGRGVIFVIFWGGADHPPDYLRIWPVC